MKLVNDTIFYGVIQSFNKAIPFFILPIIISLYGKAAYGNYIYVVTLEAIILPVITLSLEKSFNRQYFEGINVASYLSTIILFVIGIILVAGSIVATISIFFKELIFIKYAVLTAGSMFFLQILILYSRNSEEKGLYSFALLTSTFAMIALMLFFPKKEYESLVYSRFLGFLTPVTIIFFLLLLNRKVKLVFVREYFTKAIEFSTPIIFSSLLSIMFISMDKLFVKNILGSSQMGIYSVHFQLCSLLSVFLAAFNTAYIPYYFKNWEREKQQIKRHQKYAYVIILLLGMIVFTFSYGYIFYFIAEVDVNMSVLIYLTCGYLFQGFYFIEVVHFFHKNKTELLIFAPFAANIIAISLFSIMGTNISLSVASMIFMISWIAMYTTTKTIKSKI